MIPSLRFAWATMALWPVLAQAQAFSVPAATNAEVESIYGISVEANAASSVKLSVDSGTLRAEFVLRNDSTLGYSANAGVKIPLRFDGKTLDLRWFSDLSLEFRNSALITDVLSVAFGSTVYPADEASAGHVYQNLISGPNFLAASLNWKSVNLSFDDFELPTWWIPPASYPTQDSVLQGVTVLKISPNSLYTDSGFQVDGKKCAKCVGPTMSAVVLEIRKLELSGLHCDNFDPNSGITNCIPVIGLPNPALGVQGRHVVGPSNPINWKSGVLSIQDPTRWSKADLVGMDGQFVRTLGLQSRQAIDLPRGAYRVVLRAPDGRSASMAVVGVR